jgi:hypothetical protein
MVDGASLDQVSYTDGPDTGSIPTATASASLDLVMLQ